MQKFCSRYISRSLQRHHRLNLKRRSGLTVVQFQIENIFLFNNYTSILRFILFSFDFNEEKYVTRKVFCHLFKTRKDDAEYILTFVLRENVLVVIITIKSRFHSDFEHKFQTVYLCQKFVYKSSSIIEQIAQERFKYICYSDTL